MESYWLNIANFSYPACICRSGYRGDPVGFSSSLWLQKTRVPVIECGVELRDILSRFDKMPACDGQTAGHAATAHITLAQRRAVKNNEIKLLN